MLQTHHRLGEFEIVRLLGKGGMGEVYEAQQDRPRRRVALKVLAPWLAENEEFLARFWREAEVPAQLDHPGIVRIISTGQVDGVAYYTMHLVQGISLAGMIRETRDACTGTLTVLERGGNTPSVGAPQTPPWRKCRQARSNTLPASSTPTRKTATRQSPGLASWSPGR